MFTVGPAFWGGGGAACIPDPYYTPSGSVGTIFSCHFDTASGSVFVDSSTLASTLTDNGASPRVFTGDFKFGTGCGQFSTSGGANTPVSASIILDADFTIEFWAKFTSGAGNIFLFRQTPFAPSTDIAIAYNVFSNKVSMNVFGQAALATIGTVNTTSWYHVGVTRTGSTITLWLNGVSQGTRTSATSTGNSRIQLGESVTFRMDECRVTRGVARNMVDAFNATFRNCDNA